jgi:ubiquinol-cytochrome c reductase cytochrome b subunit
VIALVISIAILFIIPLYERKFRGLQFYPLNQILFWSMVSTVILLTWIGARPVEDPYILTGQVLTVIYFIFYIIHPITIKVWDEIIN